MTYRAPRQTPEQWSKLVAEYERSGDTVNAFCQRRHLALATFSKWRRRFSAPAEPPVSTANAFVEALPISSSTQIITLRVGDSLQMDLPMTLGISTITELAQAMAAHVGR